jgi:hypothetical protein
MRIGQIHLAQCKETYAKNGKSELPATVMKLVEKYQRDIADLEK